MSGDFRAEVLDFLEVAADEGPPDTVADETVPRLFLDLKPWLGERLNSLSGDCQKKDSLVLGSDGRASCTEVEVVRKLRSRWLAGWVQGFACGAGLWSEWIWKSLPAPAAATNTAVQLARGQRRPTTHSGHPDVAVTDGEQVVYIECKVKDALKETQIEWFRTAFDRKIVLPDQVAVVQGRIGI